MKATDVTTSWENLSGFIYKKVTGADTENYSAEDLETINKNSLAILKSTDEQKVRTEAKRIMDLNILDKKVSFSVFEKLPYAWQAYYGNSISLVAEEVGQMITGDR